MASCCARPVRTLIALWSEGDILIKTMLIVVSWLQTGPVTQTQVFESIDQCYAIADATAQMIVAQAQTNMTSPHDQFTALRDDKAGEWRLITGVVRREVTRLKCVYIHS